MKSTVEVMKALGGIQAVAELTGSTSKNTENWSRAAQFPSRYFLVMTEALAELGLRAPPSLWGMIERDAAAKPSRRRAVA